MVHTLVLATLLAAAPTPAPAPKAQPSRSEPARVETIRIELTNPEPARPAPVKVDPPAEPKAPIEPAKIGTTAGTTSGTTAGTTSGTTTESTAEAGVAAGAIEGVKVPASQIQTPKAAASKLAPRLVEVVIPVRVVARNQMGRRFRLVEARFVMGGTEIGRVTAPANGQEADLYAPVMVLPLRRGEHALTVSLVFQGRNVGPFSYLGNYRYRVETTYSFYLEHTTVPPIIEVIAREQGGVLTPLERRPSLEIASNVGSGVTPMTGVTHGTAVTVVR